MLPVSPLHYLLFHEAAGRPAGTEWLDKAQPFALLMTSGNPSREPPATDNIEALQRLSGIADAFLVHNRDVVAGCDDSIALSGLGGLQIIRRSRGYTPRSIKLPHPGPPILAIGGQMKNAVCVTRGQEAFVSQHIGELSNTAACAFFEETIFHLLQGARGFADARRARPEQGFTRPPLCRRNGAPARHPDARCAPPSRAHCRRAR